MKNNERNLSMLMDFYELTMSNGYFNSSQAKSEQRVAFDVFYRKNPDGGGYAIFAGLQQIIEYIQELHFEEDDIEYLCEQKIFKEEFLSYLQNFRFSGDVYAFPEGTVMYPNEPVITVVAPLIDAQLIETAILLQVNHQSLIATKASRIVRAAQGRIVSDFGARRAHNADAAVYGARAAYIGGVDSTATVLAGKTFGIPVSGTMAHSWVMYFEDEYTAFKKYAEIYPDACVLLVDTYDVLKSGIPNAIKVAKEVLEPQGKRLKGIRIDSGDLAYLSKKATMMLMDAGMSDCKVIVSNSLDEFTIASLVNQNAAIDVFGVGERLITAKSDSVFGAVYKLAAVAKHGLTFIPRIKISENVEKITNPGLKSVYRIYDEYGRSIADLIGKQSECLNFTKPFRYVDPAMPWKQRFFENYTVRKLQVPIFRNGELVYRSPSLKEIRAQVQHQLQHEVWKEELRFENPHQHYLDFTPDYYAVKMDLLRRLQK